MKILGVTVIDFMAIKTAFYELNDRGLVLIQGVNDDDTAASSNGSGKSSLVDALQWSLFGETARGSSGDAVIRNDAKKAHVVVSLEGGLSIERSRSKGKGGLRLLQEDGTGGLSDLSKGTEALTQAEIERILGCSQEVFTAAVYVAQENLPNLPAMTDKQLKVLVEEAAGVAVLERAYEAARARQGEVNHRLGLLMVKEEKLRIRRDGLKDRMHDLEAGKIAWEIERAANIARWMDPTEGNRVALVDSIARIQDRLAAMPNLVKLQKALDLLDRQIDGLKSEGEKRDALRVALAKAQLDVVAKVNEQARLQKRHAITVNDVLGIDARVGKACPECGTAMTSKHLGHARGAAEQRADEARAELETTIAALNEAHRVEQEAVETLEAHVVSMRDPKDLIDKRVKAQTVVNTIETLQGEIDRRNTEIADGDRYVFNISTVCPQQALIEATARSIGDVDDEIVKHETEIAIVTQEVEDLGLACRVFSPAGVRAHILDQVTPFLNERSSEYLSLLTDGQISALWTTLTKNAKGDLKEKFSIEVEHSSGKRSFREISGGEKRKVRIACALALQDLVASRATKPIELWIADEIDDALDDAGLERLMNVLEIKAQERGTVLVISHNDIKSWIPNTWTVVKKDGASTLVVA